MVWTNDIIMNTPNLKWIKFSYEKPVSGSSVLAETIGGTIQVFLDIGIGCNWTNYFRWAYFNLPE